MRKASIIIALKNTSSKGLTAVDNAPPHPQTIRSGDFFVVDGTGRHGSTHQLSWAVLPKTPAGTGHPLPGGLYWEQKKTEEQGSAEWYRKTG